MSGVFVYSERPSLAAELVSFGKSTGQETYVIAFSGEEVEALSQCGADKVLNISGDSDIIENNARGLADLLRERAASLLLVGATARGRDLASRVAGYLDCAMASDATAIELEGSTLHISRVMYGGAAVDEETLPLPAVATLSAGHFEATSGTSPVEDATIDVDNRVRFVENTPIVKEGTDLSRAKAIVSIGMGIDKEEDVDMVRELADQLGAELGCTRGIAEERHWLPIEQYVGLSGVSVSPNLYLTLGISGQVQHVAGIRGSKIIVAIDKNPEAPIFSACDYGIIGDLYEVVPLLTGALKKLV
mgnify:CR=1 FL=1